MNAAVNVALLRLACGAPVLLSKALETDLVCFGPLPACVDGHLLDLLALWWFVVATTTQTLLHLAGIVDVGGLRRSSRSSCRLQVRFIPS